MTITLKDRTAETRIDTGHDNAEGRTLLVIRTYHNGDRKVFCHSVRRITRTSIGTSETFAFGEHPPIPGEFTPVARYSEKALISAHAAYIERHNLDDDATIAPLIEWAKEA